jgi:tetratricopeptide (TPR) repeat protein
MTTPYAELFPPYISRDEEREILAEVDRVKDWGESSVILLTGPAGAGKTRLMRALAAQQAADEAVSWLQPIDLDDQQYWLITNLQTTVATQLDRDGEFFGRYTAHLAQPLPSTTVTDEFAVSRLSHGRRIFLDCYKQYIDTTGKAVVMVFDTVEVIRGMPLLAPLTQWMKSLPGTLFILSGRPQPDVDREPVEDPIVAELAPRHRPMHVKRVQLGAFTGAAAQLYLASSGVAAGITAEDRDKLILLAGAQPLWLAMAVSYLDDHDLPAEVQVPLAVLEREIPDDGRVTVDGKRRRENFKRRLMTPYRDAGFWTESVNRLAIVRQDVTESMWLELMRDHPSFAEVSAAHAWSRLLEMPWIRPRANGTAVTLHDGVAEELAQHIIPVNDLDRSRRKELWQRMVLICTGRINEMEKEYRAAANDLEARLKLAAKASGDDMPGAMVATAAGQAPLVGEAVNLDTRKRAIDVLKVQSFHYQMLSDFVRGCRYFFDSFEQARDAHDLLLQDLLATAMRRYLSAADVAGPFEDVDTAVIQEFRRWLITGQQEQYRRIGLTLGEFLTASGQAQAAAEVLGDLPADGASARQLNQQKILLGNAYMRIRGKVRTGQRYLDEALQVTADLALAPEERNRLAAAAYKAQGFYYRNRGLWRRANRAYEQAKDAIVIVVRDNRLDADRRELASIQSNLAYVKGLGGDYNEGLSLVASAISVRERLDRPVTLGMSLSIKGEIHRYQQKYHKAWEAYAQAEKIFEDIEDWSWLGVIYQEQAICLFHAWEDGLLLGDNQSLIIQLDEAGELARKAIEICSAWSVRNHPSALNRAGRIIGHSRPREGLRLLADGIEAARAMSDGWFWLANLVEYAEMSYRLWTETRDHELRRDITRYAAQVRTAKTEYEFAALNGRWQVLTGHLLVHDWLDNQDEQLLSVALQEYAEGFPQIAERGHVGSSGTSVIPSAFATFGRMLKSLPENTQSQWIRLLQRDWSDGRPGSALLLAELEKLY